MGFYSNTGSGDSVFEKIIIKLDIPPNTSSNDNVYDCLIHNKDKNINYSIKYMGRSMIDNMRLFEVPLSLLYGNFEITYKMQAFLKHPHTYTFEKSRFNLADNKEQ